MDIKEAKQRLTIVDLWRILNLPGKPTKSCKSPFREERNPSFSVHKNGWAWKDFTTGESGDAIDFLALATGLSKPEACKRFIELAGGELCPPLPVKQRSLAAPQARQKPVLPDMRRGTATELETLAALRNISAAACILADSVGLLRFAEWKGKTAWIVTDDERLNAQARRLDGAKWETIEGEPKVQTLPGCWASWPLGVLTGQHYPNFLLVEGGPDLLAALHFIHEAGAECSHFPIAMLGASQRIHEDALPILSGKRVRIMAHVDKPTELHPLGAGREAAERWAAQLATVNAEVDIADFAGLRKRDGSPVSDLNDLTGIHPDDEHELKGLMPE